METGSWRINLAGLQILACICIIATVVYFFIMEVDAAVAFEVMIDFSL